MFLPVYPFLLCVGLALRAMAVPAGVIRYLLKAAFVATVNMGALRRSPARKDCIHCLGLLRRKTMGFPISRAVLYE